MESDRPAPRRDLQVEPLGEELVVFSPGSGEVHRLDPAMTMVWNLLDGTRDLESITERLLGVVHAEPSALAGDIRRGVMDLIDAGVVEMRQSPQEASTSTGLGPYRMLDHRFVVDFEDSALRAWWAGAWAPLLDTEHDTSGCTSYTVSTTPARRVSVVRDGSPVVTNVSQQEAIRTLVAFLNAHVARSSTSHLVLHGALLSVGERTVAFLGESGAGKSTLAALGILGGLRYAGDEQLSLRLGTTTADPIAKPLALRAGSLEAFPELAAWMRSNHHTDLGGRSLVDVSQHSLERGPRCLTDVVLLARDGSTPRMEQVTPAHLFLALRSQCFNYQLAPRCSFATLTTVARHVTAHTLHYDDASSPIEGIRHYFA